MGEIRKQSVRGTILTYLGAILGFLIRSILFPRFLTPEQIGLIDIITAYALLFAQFGSLGFASPTTRLFSYFRTKDNNRHHGFLFITIAVGIVGAILSIIALLIFKPMILDGKTQSSDLLNQYFNLIIPLILFTIFFNSFDNYNKVLYNAIRGTFLKEFLTRVLVMIVLVLYIFSFTTYNGFIYYYLAAVCLPTIIFLFLLLKDRQFNLRPDFDFLDKEMIKTMASMSFFGIVISATGMITLNIDRIMIESYLGLEQTGIYTTAFFFGTMIILPSRSLIKISSTYVSDAWKENDRNKIFDIYKKSCIAQFIIGTILIVGIWVNIDTVFVILTDKFSDGKYVILFIALSYLADMAAGVSASIIGNSNDYKISAVFMIAMVGLIIITNIIFIPSYGITGAAFASFVAKTFINLIRFLFILIRYKMQPYNYKYLLVIGFGLCSYFAGYILPSGWHFIPDLIIRSAISTIVFFVPLYFLNVSEEINGRINTYVKFLLRKN